jgi:hypothetical protein
MLCKNRPKDAGESGPLRQRRTGPFRLPRLIGLTHAKAATLELLLNLKELGGMITIEPDDVVALG